MSTTTAGLAIRARAEESDWEDQTYSDRSVLLAAPQSFDPAKRGVIIVFFHGNNATLSRDVIARQQIVRQLADFGPQRRAGRAAALRWTREDSSAGRFWSPGGFAAFLSEAQAKLGDLYPNARGAFRRMPVVIVAYSGGYLPAAYSLAVGGDGSRVRGLVLLDALYGERDKFVGWAEGPGRSAFFVSAYSTSSREGNDAVRSQLEAAGVSTVSGLPAELTPGVVAFVDAGSVDHNDFVTSAGAAPRCATSSPASAGSGGAAERNWPRRRRLVFTPKASFNLARSSPLRVSSAIVFQTASASFFDISSLAGRS